MTKKQFKKIVADAALWMDNYIGKGGKVAKWKCPCCEKDNETPKPTKRLTAPGRDNWSSAKMCVHCGAVSFVIVPIRRKPYTTGQMTAPIIAVN